jgi:hypothetical protein
VPADGANVGLLLKNPPSTSLRFPFACLANKRRKVALTPGYINNPFLTGAVLRDLGDRRKHEMKALCRAATRSSASFH